MSNPDFTDVHNLRGDAATLRAVLLENTNLSSCTQAAEQLTNSVVLRINEAIGKKQMTKGDGLLTQALVANALLCLAAAWWSEEDFVSEPDATKVLRSFTTDLPPFIVGDSVRMDQA